MALFHYFSKWAGGELENNSNSVQFQLKLPIGAELRLATFDKTGHTYGEYQR